jgi:hypothetical protein
MDELSGAGRPEAMTSGGARTASGKRLVEGRLTASGSTVLLGELLRSWRRGQHGLRCTGGRQLLRGGLTGGDGSEPKSGERKGGGHELGLGVRPCTRGGAPAVVPGGRKAVDRPAHGGAEARCGGADRGGGTRVHGRALRWVRVQRRARSQLRAERELGVRARVGAEVRR